MSNLTEHMEEQDRITAAAENPLMAPELIGGWVADAWFTAICTDSNQPNGDPLIYSFIAPMDVTHEEATAKAKAEFIYETDDAERAEGLVVHMLIEGDLSAAAGKDWRN